MRMFERIFTITSRRVALAWVMPIVLLGACYARNTGHATAQTNRNIPSTYKPTQAESLQNIAARYGFPPPSTKGKMITLKSKYTSMEFETNSRKLIFNGLLIWMNAPLIADGSEWSLSRTDVTDVIDALLRSDKILAGTDTAFVLLDPGHGGDDPGAIGHRKVYEKKVVLDIGKRVREKLERKKIAVQLTREKDSSLNLAARTARARQLDANIFVSIHINSAHNSKAAGIETYVLPAAGFSSSVGNSSKIAYAGNKYDKQSTLLAYYVHKEILAGSNGVDRGIKRARFDVLRDAPCSAILVECGFVSNRAEEEKMLQRRYRESIAEAIAQGVLAYITKANMARK